ncbi:hypothetical protein B296_00016181 [Ensete ventricosum]|uniref:Uncharacterized protein n=1 Tax=Ensete ventricosum TaxID=4639 RepID=A0A426YKD8_ENSVE|nr:hypothetical protein B296_00016181 [Ensete ventricosum]
MRRDLPLRHRGSRCNLHAPAAPLHVITNNHKYWRCCTSSAWAVAPSAGTVALGRHLVGWWPLLPAATLVGGSPGRGATPCGFAVSSRHLRPSRNRCLRPQAMPLQAAALAGGCPYKGVLAVVGRPLIGGLGLSQLPLTAGLVVGGRPCMGAGRGWSPLLLAVLAANT